MQTRRVILNGLGHVGRSFLGILERQRVHLAGRHGLELRLCGAVDSGGAVHAEEGLDPALLVAWKASGRSVAELPGGVRGQTAPCLLKHHGADLLLEAAPTNLWNGLPGLEGVRAALQAGIPAVLSSKGPLVVAWEELAALSDWRGKGPALRFSAAVGGGLPSVNAGLRDLAGARITRLEAIVNLSSQILLARMAAGVPFEACLEEARAAGVLEADPSLDVDGWDAAAKLLILARAVLGLPVGLGHIAVEGLRALPEGEVARQAALGRPTVLLAVAEAEGGSYRLSVKPTVLEREHPFATLRPREAAIRFHSDLQGETELRWLGGGPEGTAAALLRDSLEVCEALLPQKGTQG